MIKYEGNKFALGCCDLIIQGKAPFTALYLYGPSGCGKSAMLNYIESGVFLNNPDRQVIRLSSSEFADLGYSAGYEIQAKCADADVVMMENFPNALVNGFAAERIMSILDKMHYRGQKIVLTGEKALDSIGRSINDTLMSITLLNRLNWEMPVYIASPTRNDCLAALRQTAADADICIENPDEVFSIILDAEGTNLGNVLGTLRRIAVRAQYAKEKVTARFAENVLYDGVDIELIGA